MKNLCGGITKLLIMLLIMFHAEATFEEENHPNSTPISKICPQFFDIMNFNTARYHLLLSFLNIQELVLLSETCVNFKTILYEDENGFAMYRGKPRLLLAWMDLKFFTNKNYDQLCSMELFCIQHDHYTAIIGQEYITWPNEITPYPRILRNESIQDERMLESMKNISIICRTEQFSFTLKKNGNVLIRDGEKMIYDKLFEHTKMIFKPIVWGCLPSRMDTIPIIGALSKTGDVKFMGNFLTKIKSPMEGIKIKMLISNRNCIVGISEDNNAHIWRDYLYRPVDHIGIEPADTNLIISDVSMVVCTEYALAILLKSKKVQMLGSKYTGAIIPAEIKEKLINVKMLFASSVSFAALLETGCAYFWGHNRSKKLENVKIIFADGLSGYDFIVYSKTGEKIPIKMF